MSFITLHQAHLFHNLDLLSQLAGGKQRIMAVLKDNAYGHGLVEIASLIKSYGIQKVAVKNLVEAQKIASFFDEVLVLVEHPSHEVYENSISFAIHSYEALNACKAGESIHLSLDTGMHRNGLQEAELEKSLALIMKKNLRLKGVFTHFRSSDELSSEFFWQKSIFETFKQRINNFAQIHGLAPIAFHSHNSSALLRSRHLGDDAYARCGIAMYGYSTLDPFFGKYDLKPVLSLWAEKLSTRILRKGQRVGYGGTYEAPHDEQISTYDIGYGDGFFRFDGLNPITLADNKQSKGRMSMDSFCVQGDDPQVCLFHDATKLASHFNTITYEIITQLSPFLKRKIIV